MFKIGDRVRSLENLSRDIRSGEVGTVVKSYIHESEHFLDVSWDLGNSQFRRGDGWYPRRFELAEPKMELICLFTLEEITGFEER